ncbi:LysM peptidoglycan-binding domain-containing protein [Demequina oxidasica]|uniref:LysM peptidoglycan-binding domain-containing protein n=1 Tax=Demequina oxidasica TaxID=676199 RepID=UPI000783493A|nr:LysM domain-containing protein [Demequina oxidasica]
MYLSENDAPSRGYTWAARLLLLLTWPAAWWLAVATLDSWRAVTAQPLEVDSAMGTVVTAFGAVTAAYLALSSVPLLLARRRGAHGIPRWLGRCTPHLWRKVVGVAVGGAIGASMATASFATATDITDAEPDAGAAFAVTSAGWVDSPGASSTELASPLSTAKGTHATATFSTTMQRLQDEPHAKSNSNSNSTTKSKPTVKTVKVRRGDSLWLICEGLLPDSASEADIAHAWPLLYRANKRAIGDNPSLIYAGQTLDVPAELLS